MDSNLFSDEQVEILYSDREFLHFINQYFSSFSTKIQKIDYSMNNNEVVSVDVDIYIRT